MIKVKSYNNPMAKTVTPAEIVEETVTKPVVGSANIEMSENGNKIMKMTHVALLKEVAMKKENIYRQLGMIEEAKHALLKDIDVAEKNRMELATEIQKEYDLPEGKLWQLRPDTREILVSNEQ
jgi:hypothetical protein